MRIFKNVQFLYKFVTFFVQNCYIFCINFVKKTYVLKNPFLYDTASNILYYFLVEKVMIYVFI